MSTIPWTWLGIRASGITAWGLLTAVVLWGILLRTQLLGRLASPLRLLDLHRWLGATALGFLAIHMVLLIVDPAVTFTVVQILVPGTAPWQTAAVALGTVAFWLIIPVSFLGRLRARMGVVGGRWFSRSHLLAYAAWPVATAHYVLAGTDALTQWSIALLIASTALLAMGLLARGFIPVPAPHREASPRPLHLTR
ncbi:MAG: ferric reductase-like transmembrane domain-containing protein [Actinomycetota bacterium]|nr:ferric reductase-like transmembrane domain-containing protein [Actinomycetota bacterium]